MFLPPTMSHMALSSLTPPLSLALNARTRGFEPMFRTCNAHFTSIYDSWIESYTRQAENHHSSLEWARHQCCAKTSSLTSHPRTTHACVPHKHTVTINTAQVDHGQIDHLNALYTRGQTTQTMYICAHMDDLTGGVGGRHEDAHVLHDTTKHMRGVHIVVSRPAIILETYWRLYDQ